jgi:hypothetical protein
MLTAVKTVGLSRLGCHPADGRGGDAAMTTPEASRRRARRRPVGWTLIVSLTLAALLLLLPATANAHVLKRYAKQYKAKVVATVAGDNALLMEYQNEKNAVDFLATQIQQDIANNDSPATHEQAAQSGHDALAQFAQTTESKMVAGVHAFLTKALPWFAAKSDQKRFMAGVAQVKHGITTWYSAVGSLEQAFLDLTTANLTAEQTDVTSGDMAEAFASGYFAKGQAALARLE